MPFGVVGSSPLPDDAQGPLFSLDVTKYASQAAATQAMDEGKSYGTLIAGDGLVGQPAHRGLVHQRPFGPRHRRELQTSRQEERRDGHWMKPYAPTPLAPNDPFALVCSLLLVPLLVGGYMATTLLTKALGRFMGGVVLHRAAGMECGSSDSPWQPVWSSTSSSPPGSKGSRPTRSGSYGRSWLSSS